MTAGGGLAAWAEASGRRQGTGLARGELRFAFTVAIAPIAAPIIAVTAASRPPCQRRMQHPKSHGTGPPVQRHRHPHAQPAITSFTLRTNEPGQ